MSRKTEEKLSELCQWYMSHKHTISDPDKRTQFLDVAFTNLLYLMSYYVEDLQDLEHREGRENHLYLPRGVRLDEPLRNNGG